MLGDGPKYTDRQQKEMYEACKRIGAEVYGYTLLQDVPGMVWTALADRLDEIRERLEILERAVFHAGDYAP